MTIGKAGPGYRTEHFPHIREAVIAVMRPARRKHTIHGLFEADVTDVREHLRKMKADTGESLSLTAFIVKCTAAAAMTNKHLTARRISPRRLALFDDVHVNTMVETEVDGQAIPVANLVQRANRKSVREISDQLRGLTEGDKRERISAMRKFGRLPGALRNAIMESMYAKPKGLMEQTGTALVTSVGMFGAGGGHVIPFTHFTLCVAVGGITRKPGIVENRVEPRDFLSLTASFDHDIIDGAPAARFAQELKERIEGGRELLT